MKRPIILFVTLFLGLDVVCEYTKSDNNILGLDFSDYFENYEGCIAFLKYNKHYI